MRNVMLHNATGLKVKAFVGNDLCNEMNRRAWEYDIAADGEKLEEYIVTEYDGLQYSFEIILETENILNAICEAKKIAMSINGLFRESETSYQFINQEAYTKGIDDVKKIKVTIFADLEKQQELNELYKAAFKSYGKLA